MVIEMSKKIIYHGSANIIKKPFYGGGKLYNDYGKGFYCTEHLELAKEWACTGVGDGYVNQYQLDLEGLSVCNLSAAEFTILHWLTLLVKYRKVNMPTPVMKRGAEWLANNFTIDIEKYDVLIGYRADDSYFAFARSFLNNEISLEQLSRAMKLGKLGEQIVLKSEKAFETLVFQKYEFVDSTKYYIKRRRRDEQAKVAFQKILSEDELTGLYIRDLIIQEVKADDPRIQ